MKQIRIFICMVLAGVLCFSTMALAENSSDAEALIQQGDALVEQGDTSENLEEAMKLYSGVQSRTGQRGGLSACCRNIDPPE